MDHEEFQKLAVRTESIVDKIELNKVDMETFNEILKAHMMTADMLDKFKKHIFYGRELDRSYINSAAIFSMQSISTVGVNTYYEPLPFNKVTIDIDPRIFHALLGTITEHGELAGALLEGLEDEAEGQLDLVNVCEEIGDSDWYKALFFEATKVKWNDVRSMIIKKLEARYADKIFSEGEANERDLEVEREILEEEISQALHMYEMSRKESGD